MINIKKNGKCPKSNRERIIAQKEMMFAALEEINERPAPFEVYTAKDLWADEHSSAQMLSFHLDKTSDVASRNAEFVK